MNTGELARTLCKALVDTRRSDGGWGCRSKGQAFLQATALAEMALRAHDAWPASFDEPDFLESCRLPNGLWGAFLGDSEASWMSSFALLALRCRKGTDNERAKGSAALLRWKHGYGDRLTEDFLQSARQVYHLDFRLQGWPWFAATSTWVEPTAFALLALAKDPSDACKARCEAGRRYLVDRSCKGGGWNYGNPYVLGKNLEALPLPSAAALLALSSHSEDPTVSKVLLEGRRFLLDSPRSPSSLLAASWSLLALLHLGTKEAELAPIRKAWNQALKEGRGGPRECALSLLVLATTQGSCPLVQ